MEKNHAPAVITQIKLFNFKRFREYTVFPNNRINIFVGDNEVGKSTLLEAIDLTSSGSIKRIETIGIDNILNVGAVDDFLRGDRTFEKLPKVIVELYLQGDFDQTMNGRNNTEHVMTDGIRMICEPNEDYISEIAESMKAQKDYFPFDYYRCRFSTFADEGYTGYRKRIRSVFIDSSRMNSEYATSDFVRRMYDEYTEADIKERAVHRSKYRQMKQQFKSESLADLNSRLAEGKHYSFGLKNGSDVGLESELMIYDDEVRLDQKGTGKQVFIKTDFALEKSGENVDVILIEEPENHLSHVNLRKLIQLVTKAKGGQIFLTTHNSLISTRLELNNIFIMHLNEEKSPITLHDLSTETAHYFMKTPPAGIVEFALSSKLVLVEGPSEYMMFDKFFYIVKGKSPEDEGVHIMDVRGLSFKRYLEIAKLTGAKVAVVTDNDCDYEKNCINKYQDYNDVSNVKIFFENNNNWRTFEIVLYNSGNESELTKLFGIDAVDYMLNNKTEAAYQIISKDININVPQYIRRAIEWISE